MKISRNGYKHLRLIRIVVSLAVMAVTAITAATGYRAITSSWQIIPALLACNFMWLACWVAVTLIMGRAYCSFACPMGALEDCFIAISRRRRRGFSYTPAATTLRRSVVIITIACSLAGVNIVLSLLDPAAAFSRIAVYLGGAAWMPAAFSMAGAITALLTLAVAATVSLLRGRRLCNTVCPVGTLLGALSRYAVYHVDINTDKCVGCNRCVKRCKGECINPNSHTIDLTRCVVCLDCVADCPTGAITMRRGRHRLQMPLMQHIAGRQSAPSALDAPHQPLKPIDRRAFMAAIIGASAFSAAARGTTTRLNAVTPPGRLSRDAFMERCTGCGVCVAACPAGIIRPAVKELKLRNMLHVTLDFDRGACRYDCVKCTEVCPTGALEPLSVASKHIIPIGKGRLLPENCIDYYSGEICGECARRCPTKAISMLPAGQTPAGRPRRLPSLKFDDCIGCGECAYTCPSRPRAWIIEGE